MTEENIEVRATLNHIEENEATRFGKAIYLIFQNQDLFGETIIRKAKLTRDPSGKGEYNERELDRAFKALNSQFEDLEKPLEIPSKVTEASIQKALKPIIGEDVTLYKSTGAVASENEDGDKTTRDVTYYALYPSSGGVQFANAKIDSLFKQYPNLEHDGATFTASLANIVPNNNDAVFVGEKAQPIKPPKNTMDIKGLAGEIYRILESDSNDTGFAKSAMSTIEAYMNQDRKHTLTGLLQCVSVWSKNSTQAEQLDRPTVLQLEDLVDVQSRTHVPFSDIRYTFKVNGLGEKVFQTRRMKDTFYYTTSPNDWTASFHPEDVSISDFTNLTRPIEELGLFEQSDVDSLMKMDNAYDICRTLTDIIKRNGYYLKLRVTIPPQKALSPWVSVVGLTKNEERLEDITLQETGLNAETDDIAQGFSDDDLPF